MKAPKLPLEESTLREVCNHYGVTRDEVLSNSRLPEHTKPRHDWWATLWASGWGYSQIGRVCGFHHTTVMYVAKSQGWGGVR